MSIFNNSVMIKISKNENTTDFYFFSRNRKFHSSFYFLTSEIENILNLEDFKEYNFRDIAHFCSVKKYDNQLHFSFHFINSTCNDEFSGYSLSVSIKFSTFHQFINSHLKNKNFLRID